MKKIFLAVLVLSMVCSFAFSQTCSPSTVITMPFVKDGAGQFCYEATCIGTPINSWNMTQLTINGVDFTNKWADATTLPAPVNGKYYISYNGGYSYSHFEATGSCSGTVTGAPTAVPTTGPTGAPGAGQVWISPASQSVNAGSVVTIDIHANTGSASLAAFGFTVTYPSNLMSFGTIAEITTGLNLTNNTTVAGQIVTAGFNATGVAASSDLSLIRITLNATAAGTANIGLSVKNLNDTAGNVIGSPSGTGATVTIGGTTTAAPTAVPTAVVTTAPTAVPTTAPTTAPGAGQVWISPASQSVAQGAAVTIDIHANTGSTALGAFGFTITYPSNLMSFGTIAEITSGLNLTNNTTVAGQIVTAGFNATGVAGSSDLSLMRITLNATAAGTANIGLSVKNLNDTTGNVIGSPAGTGATVTINGTVTAAPTAVPTAVVTTAPTAVPTTAPTAVPTAVVTTAPTAVPTAVVTTAPTAVPTTAPTAVPTTVPTAVPTAVVTAVPTTAPTAAPTVAPTVAPAGPGSAWIVPATQTVTNGATGVKIVMHVNTGTSLLAAYGIDITYNSTILGSPVATAEAAPGFMTVAGFATPGSGRVSGFDTAGRGPGTDLPLFNVTFTAIARGTSTIGVSVGSFVDQNTTVIGTPNGIGGSITVN